MQLLRVCSKKKTQDAPYSPRFKATVALAAIKGKHTKAQLALMFQVEASTVELWKKQALTALPEVFSMAHTTDTNAQHDLKLTLANEIREVRAALHTIGKPVKFK